MTHKDLTQGPKVKTHVMLTRALLAALDRRREETGVSRSWMTRRALADHLADKNVLADRVRQHEAELEQIAEALIDCGIGGIYAEFDGAADAIQQMARHIKEQTAQTEIAWLAGWRAYREAFDHYDDSDDVVEKSAAWRLQEYLEGVQGQ